MKTYSVYGPPGCGKTTEMLRRLEEVKNKYSIQSICFLSFTKAGAAEALKRLSISKSDRICTIHSLMFRLTNCSAAAVVDHYKLRDFTKRTGFRFKGTSNDTAEQMEVGDQYLSLYAKIINERSSIKAGYYESDRPGSFEEFKSFSKSYTEWKKSNGYVDFNDMILFYVNNPVNHGCEVVFIDEAQDLSELQWSAIREMLKFDQVKEVHIAGDDDQAIYEWSGASPHGMLDFENLYQSDRKILTQSWRVPASVHKKAMSVIGTVKNRVSKLYLPREEEGVLRRINQINPRTFGVGEDVLILCRNFVARKEIEEELIRWRVPYINEGGPSSLFGSRIADAIRLIQRLEAGEAISNQEFEKISAVGDHRTKEMVKSRDIQGLLKRGYMRSLMIPPNLVDFYREADLSQTPTVKLSTIHSAKGREADRVVVHTGLTNRTVRDMDINPDAEARVWYVAVTRSRHTLEILEGDNGYNI